MALNMTLPSQTTKQCLKVLKKCDKKKMSAFAVLKSDR